MKTVLSILSLLIAMELLILSFKLFTKKEFRHTLYLILGIISLFSTFWPLGYGIMYSTSDKNLAIFAYRLSSIGWTLGLNCWFLFFYELYSNATDKPRKIYLHVFLFIIGIVFWWAALEGNIYANDLKFTAWWGWREIVIKNSVWVFAYDLFVGILVVMNLYQISITVRRAGLKKHTRQLKLIGITFAAVTIPSALLNLALPVFNISSVPPLGSFLMSSVALIIGYIAIKYRVLDLNPNLDVSQILFEISDYVFLTDLKGLIRKVSNASLNILNYDSNEIIKKNISEITRILNVEDLNLKVGESSPTFKTEIISSGNIAVPVRCKATLVKDSYNDPVGYLLIMSDLRDMIAIEDLENAVSNRTSELAEKNRKLLDEIKERTKAQEALANIDEIQKAMISNISDVIAIVSHDGKIIFNSPNLFDIFGWVPEQVIGKSAFLVIHPDDLEMVKNVFSKSLRVFNSTRKVEFRYRCGNGNYKVVHMTILNKLNDPLINGMLLNYYDITESAEIVKERQLKADRIEKQHEALRKITNNELFKLGNKDAAFKLITETAADILDLKITSIWFFQNIDKELACIDFFDKSEREHSSGSVIKTESFPDYLNDLRTGLSLGIDDVLNDERTKTFRDSYFIPLGVRSLLSAGIRMSGKLIGVFVLAHTGNPRNWFDDEITFANQLADLITQAVFYNDRRIMEDKLRLFANTIKSVSENISITDMNDVLIFINESFCKTYGYEEHEIIGKSVTFLRSDKNLPEQIDKILPSTKLGKWEGELWNRKKDGTDFLIHLSTSIIKDEFDVPVALVGIATDITEQKKEEEKLFSLVRFQSEMLETAAMWINTLDKCGNITFWNKAAETISGYSKEEVLLKNTIWDLLYPDIEYKAKIYSEVNDIIFKNKRTENYLTTIRRKDGENRIIAWYSNNLADEKGETVGSIAVGIDNTEKIRAEETLRENEEKYRILLDESTDPIFSFSADGRYLYANRAFVTGVGKTVDEVLGKYIWDVFPKDEADKRFTAVKYVFETGMEKTLEVRVPRVEGDRFYITSVTPIKNNLGKVVTVICSSKDITDRKLTEDALRLSEQKLRLHFEQTPLGVIEWDENLHVVSWNKAAELIFGYSVAEAFGRDTDFIIPPELRLNVDDKLLDLIAKNTVGKSINENVTKEGKVILCEWYNTPLTAGNGEVIGIASLVMDITERRIAEEEQNRLMEELKSSRAMTEAEAVKLALLNEQLLESEEKLKELNASKDKFFSIIAHDLKSPFLSLLGYSEILSNEYDSLTEDEKKESISSIFQLSNNSYKLLENLLQWSRIQIGKVDFYPEPFNLFYELSPALMLLTQTAKNKNISIQNNIDRKAFVTADKNMVNTIVRNLISNSIKFSNRGGKIILESCEVEGFTQVSVKDDGVGLDESQLENLFSIDKNNSTKGTANEAGTGLGLLLCKEMVEKNGGKISVLSEPGKGSEFIFTIPNGK